MSGWFLAAQVAGVLIKLSKTHNQRLQMQGAAEEIRGNLDLISVDNIENLEARASILGSKDSMLKQLGSLVSQTPTTGDMFGFGISALGNILQEHSAYKARQTEREEAATARAQMEHFERVSIQTKQLQDQLKEYREDSMAAFERAEPLLKREKYIQAAEFYHTAIENLKKSIQEGRSERSLVNDMLADNYVKMGFACYQAGMYRRAVESLQEGIKLRPGDSNIHTYLGMSYCKLEQYEKAITHFNTSLQQDKLHLTYAYLYYARGMAAKKEENVVEANKWFDKTIKTLDDHVFDEGMHSSELYLMKANALLGITITGVATDIYNQKRRLVVKAIRSYTESLKLLSTEAKYSIAREEIFVLRAQAYIVLEELIPESSEPPLEFSVRTPLFSGNNKSTKSSHAAGRRRVYFFGRSVEVGADHREAQYEPEREPENLSDTSDEEVTIRVPTSTTEVKSRLTYKRKDITQNALQDARAAFALNPYSHVALEILKNSINAAERVLAEENLRLDDYEIAQRFESGRTVDEDMRRAAYYYNRLIASHSHSLSAARVIEAYADSLTAGRESALVRYLEYSFNKATEDLRRLCAIAKLDECKEGLYCLAEKSSQKEKWLLAFAYYKEAADGGHAEAAFMAAKMLFKSYSRDRDRNDRAIEYADKAASMAHAEANYWLGLKYKVRSDSNIISVPVYRRKVEGALSYEKRLKIEENPKYVTAEKDIKYWMFFSDATHRQNCWNYDGRVEEFVLLMKSWEKALYYFKRAADLHHPRAAREYSMAGESFFAKKVLLRKRPKRFWATRLFLGDRELSCLEKNADEFRAECVALIPDERSKNTYRRQADAYGISSSDLEAKDLFAGASWYNSRLALGLWEIGSPYCGSLESAYTDTNCSII